MSTEYVIVSGYQHYFNTVILSWIMIIFIFYNVFLYYNDMAKWIRAKVIIKCTLRWL
jgi:hypothetical protein